MLTSTKSILLTAGFAASVAMSLGLSASAEARSRADTAFAHCAAKMGPAHIETCCAAWVRHSRDPLKSHEGAAQCAPYIYKKKHQCYGITYNPNCDLGGHNNNNPPPPAKTNPNGKP